MANDYKYWIYTGWQWRNFDASCFRRRLVGKTLVNVFHCDIAEIFPGGQLTPFAPMYGRPWPVRSNVLPQNVG